MGIIGEAIVVGVTAVAGLGATGYATYKAPIVIGKMVEQNNQKKQSQESKKEAK